MHISPRFLIAVIISWFYRDFQNIAECCGCIVDFIAIFNIAYRCIFGDLNLELWLRIWVEYNFYYIGMHISARFWITVIISLFYRDFQYRGELWLYCRFYRNFQYHIEFWFLPRFSIPRIFVASITIAGKSKTLMS